MRLATWNINSVRLRVPLLQQMVAEFAPDVICLQETKTADEFFPHDDMAAMGYDHRVIWGQKSYNGVAILSRLPLTDFQKYDRCGKADCRHISVRLPDGTVLHNLYIPAGGYEADVKINPKFQHKLDFVDEMTAWWPLQPKGKKILVGDLNIAPLEHDVWDSKKMQRVVSHTPEEISRFSAMQKSVGWIDVAREFTPHDEKLYSWWSYRAADWDAADRGRRLDHIWVTPELKDRLRACITPRTMRHWKPPSDHVPVIVDFKD
ncbi:MAG TPA: exodeoxyribonuclease III [Rhodospirillaceae bacterium]|nr:exodeoxyribonuclease III [Rhodospirillaceae bacterium]